MESVSLSPLENFSSEILSLIGFHTVTDTFLGPPAGLIPLLCTSPTIYDALSFKNSHLYASIFRFKFDIEAPVRRLTQRWTTTKCLASELRKRFAALRRIRARNAHYVDDLWTAYLLMIESDGKNERQLIEWANIETYLATVIVRRALTPVGPSSLWLTETTGTALTIWLLWLTASQETIQGEAPQTRLAIVEHFLHPFLVVGHRYPSVHAPDSHFDLPLCPGLEVPAPWTSGPPPKATKIIHYSHELVLAAPVLTSPALLATTVRIEAMMDRTSHSPANFPANREIANILGQTGPTLEDVREFHYGTRTRFVERCGVAPDMDDEDEAPECGSIRHDEDWSRLVSCHDPWIVAPPLRGKVFTLGALSGCWTGRFCMPEVEPYWNLVVNPHLPCMSTHIGYRPLNMHLQEHHCLEPNARLRTGTDALGWGDDILNAWLPRGIIVRNLEDAIEVFDPTTESAVRYETFFPNRPAPYSKSACEKLQISWITVDEKEEIVDDSSDSGAMAPEEVPYIDDDNEFEDTVEHKSSGVSDILVTGVSAERHGDAWGHFTYLGRVRPWDGLISLLRIPRDATHAHSGRWIFKGYIHDQNFVGRWRETSTNVDSIGFEAGFVMCKSSDSDSR